MRLTEPARSLLRLYFSWHGRASRSTWWLFTFLPAITLNLILNGLNHHNTPYHQEAPALLTIAVGALSTWIAIVGTIKRHHDRDASGWFALIALIPILGGIWSIAVCGFKAGSPSDNRFGPPPGAAL
jgi:uncharacterized membrane protein YhaH (DUF805 family)